MAIFWTLGLLLCVMASAQAQACVNAYGAGSVCKAAASCTTISDPSTSLCTGGQTCCTEFLMTNSFKFYNPTAAPWQKTALDNLQNTLRWYAEFRNFACKFRNKTPDGTYCGGEDGMDEIKMSNVAQYYAELTHQNEALDYLQGVLLSTALRPAFLTFVKTFRNVGRTEGPGGYLPPAPVPNGPACNSPVNNYPGKCIDVNACTGGTFNGQCAGGTNIKCCVTETIPASPTTAHLSVSAFNSLFTGISGARATAFRFYLNDALDDILADNPSSSTRCHRIAAFVAQIGHESLGLLYFEEIASGADYEGRCSDLGNCQSGDGVRYKGRGPIQLTGRANYRSASRDLNTDWEAAPDKVCFPSGGFRAAAWFWMRNRLNRFCTGNFNDFTALSRAINGGTNGLADRRARWATAKSLLGCSGTAAASFVFEEAGILGNETDPESVQAAQQQFCSDVGILRASLLFVAFLLLLVVF